MAFIQLTRGLVAVVDDADAHLLAGRKWTAKPIDRKTGGFYACAWKPGGTIYMHRLLLQAGAGQMIDHVDGDGLNNSRCNLRFCSLSENNANRAAPKPSGTGFRGVYKKGNRFRANVGRGQTIWRGPYRVHAIDAAFDYDREAGRRFGEFARLNFPCASQSGGA